LFADDPSEIPSDRDAEGDDGGVVLEDPAAELAGRGAPPPSSAIDQTMIVPPNPMFRNPPPSAAPTGAARPKAMEHMVLKTRSKGGGDENLLKQDVGQFGGARQIGLIVLAVAVCAAIFWGVMNLTEQVVPEGGIPDAVEDVDGGD
ncbi:MAG: hypothetical protein KC636_39295, partial [Myxococcales bacterium]|nr:hypothetical protein [Myxococcales bacterium]